MLWLRVVVAVGAVVAAILVTTQGSPPDPHKRAAATQREIARLAAARRNDPAVKRERARRAAEQRPHVGRVPGRRPSRAAQAAITAALERSITRDAQARYRRHELDHPVLDTTCDYLGGTQTPRPPPPLGATAAGFDCTAVTVRLTPVAGVRPSEIIGFPFLARVNFRTGRYVWCKVSRRPAEHGTGDELAFVPVPKVCDVLPGRA